VGGIQLVGEVETRDRLHDLIVALGPDAEEVYMTIAELHRAEGRVEGRLEGRVEILVQQLTLKFGPLPEAVLTTVRNASADQLQAWTARVLTADALDQLLR